MHDPFYCRLYFSIYRCTDQELKANRKSLTSTRGKLQSSLNYQGLQLLFSASHTKQTFTRKYKDEFSCIFRSIVLFMYERYMFFSQLKPLITKSSRETEPLKSSQIIFPFVLKGGSQTHITSDRLRKKSQAWPSERSFRGLVSEPYYNPQMYDAHIMPLLTATHSPSIV